MLIIVLLDENKHEVKRLSVGDSIQLLIRAIKTYNIEIIVVGQVDTLDNSVVWEKQYQEITVMPTRQA